MNLEKLKDELKDGKLDRRAEGEACRADRANAARPCCSGERDEMGMLDDAEMQLAQAKEQMNCKCCNGVGCKECQGGQPCQGEEPGHGFRRGASGGVWAAFRPVRLSCVGCGASRKRRPTPRSYDSQVKQKVGRGSATVVGVSRRAERQRRLSAADPEAGPVGPPRHDRSVNRPSHAPQKHGEHARGIALTGYTAVQREAEGVRQQSSIFSFPKPFAGW